ncbi:MAG: peptidylprolyl isomerase [Bacteroidota bacterium]
MSYRFQLLLTSVGFVFVLMIGGCASQESAVVATLGDDKITLDEFNRMFAKNNTGKDTAKATIAEDREAYLDLYVKFRLKLKEAYDRGYQNDPGIQAEVEDYRRSFDVSSLIEHDITEPALHRMYERKLVNVRPSHILLRMSPTATPAETLQTYMKAMKIIDSLKTGHTFEDLALRNSQDQSVNSNKGDLYYFPSGSTVPEFEDAVFSAQPGIVIPYPVRTQFGYHIIKVTAREPNPGSIRVSHIYKRLTPGSTPQDSAKAMKALEGALDSLKHGGKFADLARSLSDDKTRDRGGDLGFIERRRTVKEFDDAAFSLKVGEVSGIVKSQFGLHLIMVTDKKPVPSFESMEQELRNFFQAHRFQAEYGSYVAGLKKGYNFMMSAEAVSAWHSSLDTAKTTSSDTWDSLFSAATRAKALFTFAGQKITIDSVIHRVKMEKDLQGLSFSNPSTSVNIFDKISKDLVVEYKARSVESQIPDFEKTIKEYEEGSMLFKSEQIEVWNKLSTNDSAMHIYFDANRSNFTWPDRVNLREIYVPTDSVAVVVTFLLKKQKLPFDSVAAQFNTRLSTKQKNGEWGLTPVTTSALTKQAWNMNVGEVSEFLPYENGFSIFKVLEKSPAGNKTFAEAGSELASAFQEYETTRLENEWHESLLKKYPVHIFKEMLTNSPEQSLKK